MASKRSMLFSLPSLAALAALAMAVLAFAPGAQAQGQGPNNVLTPAETTAGWKLLFNGTSNAGWIRPDGSAGRFVPEDSALRTAGGDICTQAEYDSYEISIDYKYDAGGNSGVFLRTKKGVDPPWLNGMEVGIQDNGRAGNLFKNGDASVYDVIAPSKDTWLGPLKWNRLVIWLSGSKLEHWHNGQKVVDQDMASTAFKNAVAASKFSDQLFTSNNWGKETKGQVCIQDHGPEHKIWFRNIKIRTLVPGGPLPEPLATPAGGSVSAAVTVKLEVAAAGAAIHYTLDGSAPTAASPVYTAPFRVTTTTTLKAMSVRTGAGNSPVHSQTYSFGPSAIAVHGVEDINWDLRSRGPEAGLHFRWPGPGALDASLFDAFGRKVAATTARPGMNFIPMHGLPPGLYWFQARDGATSRVGRIAWY